MLLEGDGEAVGAVIGADINLVVVVVGFHRVDHGLDGGEPGAGDGSRRQSGKAARVVGRVAVEVGEGQLAAGLPPAVGLDTGRILVRHAVLGGGVDAEAVACLDAVEEHARDDGALLRHRDLALDEGGEGEHLVGGEAEAVGGLAQVGGETQVHGLGHQLHDLGGGPRDGDVVGVGEEIALGADALGKLDGEAKGKLDLAGGGDELLGGAEARLVGDLGHLLDAQPLREGDEGGFDLIDDRDGANDGEGRVAGLEGVDAGDEAVLEAEERGEDLELGGRADDAELLELAGHVVGGAAFGEDVALRGTGLAGGGRGKGVAAESGAGRAREQGGPHDHAGDDDAEAERHEHGAPAEQVAEHRDHAPPPARESRTAWRRTAAAAESSEPSRRWSGGT